jgi:hypothetical protein
MWAVLESIVIKFYEDHFKKYNNLSNPWYNKTWKSSLNFRLSLNQTNKEPNPKLPRRQHRTQHLIHNINFILKTKKHNNISATSKQEKSAKSIREVEYIVAKKILQSQQRRKRNNAWKIKKALYFVHDLNKLFKITILYEFV